MLPAALIEEVKSLTDEGLKVELVEADGMACVILPGYQLPRGYNKACTDLLLMLPLSYRNGKPDMFWVESDVVLVNGSVPKAAEKLESHLGRQWRRFSWHLKSWNPAVDDLRTYLEFVNSRLVKGV